MQLDTSCTAPAVNADAWITGGRLGRPAGLRFTRRYGHWAEEPYAELVERCAALARRFAVRLAGAEGGEVLNEVVLNQVGALWQPTVIMMPGLGG